MSNQEVIVLLRNLEDALDSYCELNEEGKTAFRMAIEALQQGCKKGEWIKKKSMIYCSYCACSFDSIFINNFNYCPNCGAEMKIDKEKN